ncbi:helix-turn-helix domain-containing protein [Deinococcus sp. YIM 77859]|uniref:helix-turn-helix domain-containing protein n=1 Tax=Deinococcus sp. YIM 77859 TaxID=1540221 RepID=UPI000555F6BD|nr:helix-turn-helix domain-containing protein [Deinococcus sp. YIM 77859]
MTAINPEELGVSSPIVPAFLSVPDAAAYLGVHPALVYKEIRAGRLRAVKIGAKVIRIPREALEAYTAAQSTGAN